MGGLYRPYLYLLDKGQVMGKCQQKNVWLFVYAMSVAGSPSFGKTLLTRILHIILNKNSVEESLILLRLSCFWVYLCLSPVFEF